MITTKLYLDTRAVPDKSTPAPMTVAITKHGKTSLLQTGMKFPADQWNAKTCKIINNPARQALNTTLQRFLISVQDLIQQLRLKQELTGLTAVQIKNRIKAELDGDPSNDVSFVEFFEKVIASKTTSATSRNYASTLNRIKEFDSHIGSKSIQSLDVAWVNRFSKYVSEDVTQASLNFYLRHMKHVFAQAQKDGLIRDVPFQDIKMKATSTKKRSLSQDKFARIWNAETISPLEKVSLDIFKLSFLLIGANSVDLAALKTSDIYNDRVEYDRSKTGRHYSIRVEPEALELINSMKEGEVVCPFFTKRRSSYRSAVSDITLKLHDIAERAGVPKISLYWARHSWASFAAELEIPIETISAALGHSVGSPTTLIYIAFNQKKIDDANRRVIDYALYGKK